MSNRADLNIIATELCDDKILIAYDTRQLNNLPKTYATPIGFEVLDLNLDIVHYEEMGKKFTLPADILRLEDGQIAVLGFVNNNWEFEDTRSENEIYLWIGDMQVVADKYAPSAKHLEATLFPNPVRDWMTITFNAPQRVLEPSFLEMYSMSGQLVSKKSLGVLTADLSQNIQVDLSEMPSGTYTAILRLEDIRYSLGSVSKQ